MSQSQDIHFVVGVEEPLRANQQLYALDEKSDEIALADFSLTEINRYCFLPVGLDEWDAVSFPAGFVRRLVAILGSPCWWVHLWKCNPSGAERIRNRVRIGKLEKAGWEVKQGQGVCVAITPFDGAAVLGFGTNESPREYGGTLLMQAKLVGDELLFESPATKSFRQMASSWHLSPSREMLTYLSQIGVTVGYLSIDFRDRPGIVVVAGEHVPLEKLGPHIAEVRSGRTATTVWRASVFG